MEPTIITDEQVKEIDNKAQCWLADEMDHWTDDKQARWIIKRVPQLIATLRHVETERKEWENRAERITDMGIELQQENARLRDALGWYADEDNYAWFYSGGKFACNTTNVNDDFGEKARQALATETDGDKS